MDSLTDPQIWIALATLTFLEIVLGVDNIIFISILSGKLPADQQKRARRRRAARRDADAHRCCCSRSPGSSRLTEPLFTIGRRLSGPRPDPDPRRPVPDRQEHLRDPRQARRRGGHGSAKVAASFASVIVQIMLLDIVFSLDSVITAVGMVDELWVMVTAVIIAVGIMMCPPSRSAPSSHKHPTVKMLALSASCC